MKELVLFAGGEDRGWRVRILLILAVGITVAALLSPASVFYPRSYPDHKSSLQKSFVLSLGSDSDRSILIMNTHSTPPVDGNWTIYFSTTGSGILEIYGEPFPGEVSLVGLYRRSGDGWKKVPVKIVVPISWNGGKIEANWSHGEGKAVFHVNMWGNHTLAFRFGNVAYAHNDASTYEEMNFGGDTARSFEDAGWTSGATVTDAENDPNGNGAFDDTGKEESPDWTGQFTGIYQAVRTDEDLSDITGATTVGAWVAHAEEEGGVCGAESGQGYAYVERTFDLDDYITYGAEYDFVSAKLKFDYKIDSLKTNGNRDFDNGASYLYLFARIYSNDNAAWYNIKGSPAYSQDEYPLAANCPARTGTANDYIEVWDPTYSGEWDGPNAGTGPEASINDHTRSEVLIGGSTYSLAYFFDNYGTTTHGYKLQFMLCIDIYSGDNDPNLFEFWIDDARIELHYGDALADDVPETGTIATGDTDDYYYFSAGGTSSWTVMAEKPPSGVDYDLRVYSDNSYSTQVDASLRDSGYTDFVVLDTDKTGTFYGKVEQYSGTGTYTVEMENSATSLTAYDPQVGGAPTSGVLTTSEIVDLYQIDLTAGVAYNCTLDAYQGSDDLDLYIFKDTGDANNDYVARGITASGDEKVPYTPSLNDKYSLVVVREGNVTGDVRYTVGCTYDSTAPKVTTPQTNWTHLSPNGDGEREHVNIYFAATDGGGTGPCSYDIDISAYGGGSVRTYSGTVTNLAYGKIVTTSVAPTVGSDACGSASCIVDEIASSVPYLYLGSGTQWVQVDLGATYDVNAIHLWHYWADGRTYYDVKCALSATGSFSGEETVVFNNGAGGDDPTYAETRNGKLITFSPTSARYVRCWSDGSSADVYNHYTEIKVYGVSQIWDGKYANGTVVPDGTYNITASACDCQGVCTSPGTTTVSVSSDLESIVKGHEVVAETVQCGWTGTSDVSNSYSLTIAAADYDSGARYYVCGDVAGMGGTDSNGDVSVGATVVGSWSSADLRMMHHYSLKHYSYGGWNTGWDYSTENTSTFNCDIHDDWMWQEYCFDATSAITASGTYTVTWDYTGGDNKALKIKKTWIEKRYEDNAPTAVNTDADGKVRKIKEKDVKKDVPNLFSLTGTSSGAANAWAYQRIWEGSYTIQSGDYLEYYVYLPATNPEFKSAIDLDFSDGSNLRDADCDTATAGVQRCKDQNNLNAHPGTDLSGYAKGRWYHRNISIGETNQLAGKVITGVDAVLEGDASGSYESYFRDVVIKNAASGETVLNIGFDVQNDKVNVPSNEGYSSYSPVLASQFGTIGPDLDIVYTGSFDDETGWIENQNGNSWKRIEAADGSSGANHWAVPVDFNRDGDIEILMCDQEDDDLVFYHASQAGGNPFQGLTNLPNDADAWTKKEMDGAVDCRAAFPVDIDRDGDADAVFAAPEGDPFDDSVGWLEAPADPIGGAWTRHNLVRVNNDDENFCDPYGVWPADIDADERVDVTSSSTDNADAGIETCNQQKRNKWFKQPDPLPTGSPFAKWTTQTMTQDNPPWHNWEFLVTADMDQDGDLDIVYTDGGDLAGKGGSADRLLWLQQPADPLTSPWAENYVATNLYGPLGIRVADIDKDGDPDIVIAEGSCITVGLDCGGSSPYDTDRISWFRNDGGATSWTRFTIADYSSLGYYIDVWAIDIADLDRDGDWDVIAGDNFDYVFACWNPYPTVSGSWECDRLISGPTDTKTVFTWDMDHDTTDYQLEAEYRFQFTDEDPSYVSKIEFVTDAWMPEGTVNIARNRDGAASSLYGYSSGCEDVTVIDDYLMERIADGDLSTTWGACGNVPQWVRLDFKSQKTIYKINGTTANNAYFANAFSYKYWTGSEWADIPGCSFSGVTQGESKECTFSPITTRYVNVSITGTNTEYTEFAELKVYAWEAVPIYAWDYTNSEWDKIGTVQRSASEPATQTITICDGACGDYIDSSGYVKIKYDDDDDVDEEQDTLYIEYHDIRVTYGTAPGQVVVDTVAPSVSLGEYSPDPTSDNTPSYSGSATDERSVLYTAMYQADPTCGSGTWYYAQASDGSFDELSESIEFTTQELDDGTWNIRLTAQDKAGNWGFSSCDELTIDATPPNLRVIAPISAEGVALVLDNECSCAWTVSDCHNWWKDELRKRGFGIALVNASDIDTLAEITSYEAILNPYGEYYPETTGTTVRDNIKEYVKEGGYWFESGGYSFYYSCGPAPDPNTATDLCIDTGWFGGDTRTKQVAYSNILPKSPSSYTGSSRPSMGNTGTCGVDMDFLGLYKNATDGYGPAGHCYGTGCIFRNDQTTSGFSPDVYADLLRYWQNSSFYIRVKDYDATTGLKQCNYSVSKSSDEGKSWNTVISDGARTCSSEFQVTVGPGTQCSDEGKDACKVGLKAVDNVDNIRTIERIYGIDWTAPACSVSITEGTNPSYQYVSGTQIWYNTAVSGDFTVNSGASDATSGVAYVSFPSTVSGGGDVIWTPSASWTYSWDTGDTFSGSSSLTVYDNATNPVSCSFTVTRDVQAPSGGSISYIDGYNNTGSVVITVDEGNDNVGGSGKASVQLYKRTATFLNNDCGTYGGWVTEGTQTLGTTSVTVAVANGTCYQFKYSVTDNVSNVGEYTSASEVKVDTVAPTTAYSLSGTEGWNGWYTTDVTVTLTCDDPGSGCSSTNYRINGGSWTTYSAPFTVTAEGSNTVDFNSTDNAGNAEITNSITIKIDKTSPAYNSYTVQNCDYVDGSTCWVKNGTTTYHLIKHTDTVSTPYRQYLAVTKNSCIPGNVACNNNANQVRSWVNTDNTAVWNQDHLNDSMVDILITITCAEASCTDTDATMNWTVVAGTYEFDYGIWTFMYDEASNGVGYTNTTWWYKVDASAPTTGDNFDSTWRNTNFTGTITCTDTRSGCNYIQYCIDTDGSPDCAPSTNCASGSTCDVTVSCASGSVCTGDYLRHRAVDNVSNWSSVVTSPEIRIDKEAPTPSPATIASVVADSSSQITVTATPASDGSGAGLDANPYNFEVDGTWQGWQSSNVYVHSGLVANTSHCYRVQYRDALGNTGTASSQTCRYTLPTAPNLSSASPAENTWSSDDTIDISVSATSDHFHYVWDQNSGTAVDETDTNWTGTTTTFTATSDGYWYLHVISHNPENAANSGGTQHFGPWKIDTEKPVIGLVEYQNEVEKDNVQRFKVTIYDTSQPVSLISIEDFDGGANKTMEYEGEDTSLRLRVTDDGSVANSYVYRVFNSSTSHVISSDEYLEFDIYISGPQIKGGFDAMVGGLEVRDNTGWVDQNGVSIHPGTDLSAYADGKWYHRRFFIGNKAGETLDTFKIVHEGDSAGNYDIRLDNIKITTGSGIVKRIYKDGAPPTNASAEGPTSSITSYTLDYAVRTGSGTGKVYSYSYTPTKTNKTVNFTIYTEDNVSKTNESTASYMVYILRSINLSSGWNLVSLPVDEWETITTEELAQELGMASMEAIVGQNRTTKKYDINYVVPWSIDDDEPILPGYGYWIGTNAAAGLHWRKGGNYTSITNQLKAGLNLIGSLRDMTAAELCADVNSSSPGNAQSVSRYNPSWDNYTTHICGTPDDNFAIFKGVGYWVRVENDVSWIQSGDW